MKKIECVVGVLSCLLMAVFSVNALAESTYKINPGDLLRVDVWNEESLTREIIVQPDGYISFPLAGSVAVGGISGPAAEAAIADALSKFLKDVPTVTVAVQQLLGNKIYVLGKVNRPGEYPINRPTDVMQALAMGGGLNAFAAENSIQVLRRDEAGKQIAIPFEYAEVKDGEQLETNIILQSGDVVVVP